MVYKKKETGYYNNRGTQEERREVNVTDLVPSEIACLATSPGRVMSGFCEMIKSIYLSSITVVSSEFYNLKNRLKTC